MTNAERNLLLALANEATRGQPFGEIDRCGLAVLDEQKHFAPCTVCGLRMPKAPEGTFTIHPTCNPFS